MTALVAGVPLAGALVAVWWWLEGSLRWECRRPLTDRDVAALRDLELARADKLADQAER